MPPEFPLWLASQFCSGISPIPPLHCRNIWQALGRCPELGAHNTVQLDEARSRFVERHLLPALNRRDDDGWCARQRAQRRACLLAPAAPAARVPWHLAVPARPCRSGMLPMLHLPPAALNGCLCAHWSGMKASRCTWPSSRCCLRHSVAGTYCRRCNSWRQAPPARTLLPCALQPRCLFGQWRASVSKLHAVGRLGTLPGLYYYTRLLLICIQGPLPGLLYACNDTYVAPSSTWPLPCPQRLPGPCLQSCTSTRGGRARRRTANTFASGPRWAGCAWAAPAQFA